MDGELGELGGGRQPLMEEHEGVGTGAHGSVVLRMNDARIERRRDVATSSHEPVESVLDRDDPLVGVEVEPVGQPVVRSRTKNFTPRRSRVEISGARLRGAVGTTESSACCFVHAFIRCRATTETRSASARSETARQ